MPFRYRSRCARSCPLPLRPPRGERPRRIRGALPLLCGLFLGSTCADATVALNEILASNRGAVRNGDSEPDFVELRNTTDAPVSLAGWSLTNDSGAPEKFPFPANATIPAGGHLVVWCDNATNEPGLHSGFAIAASGQMVLLYQGATLRDSVTFGPQAEDLSIGRVPDGVGAWTLVTPSPVAANAAVPLGQVSTLKINEWMASPLAGDDWFELYNPDDNPVALGGLHLSDTPARPSITRIPPLSFIRGKGFTVFEASGQNTGGNQCNFQLSANGEQIVLTDGAVTVDRVVFGQQARGLSQGRLPDGAETIVFFPAAAAPLTDWQRAPTPTQGASNYSTSPVVISEVLANPAASQQDLVELFNPTSAPVDISGWWLSDGRVQPQKYVFPAGTTLPAGGYLVVDEARFNAGPRAFAFSSQGDDVVLTAIAGGVPTGFRDQISFGPSGEGVSLVRVLTNAPSYQWPTELWPSVSLTFGAANAPPVAGPVVINEVMYHPPDIGGADNERDEFIELHNSSAAPVNLGGWVVRGSPAFTFPAGTTVPPGGYLLLVTFDPAADAAAATAFRAKYGLASATPLFGSSQPKLPNSEGRVELARPGAPLGNVGAFILVDKLEYFDGLPFAATADGGGFSLQRTSPGAFGNDPAHWRAALPTPGAANPDQQPSRLDSDGDGMSDAEELIAGTDPHNAASFFRADATPVAGGIQIAFEARPGKTYSILRSDTLASGSWEKLADIPAQPTLRTETHTDATTAPRRAYKVVTPGLP